MKKWKRPATLLLALVMILGLHTAALAEEKSTYEDVSGHWAETYINRMLDQKLMEGRSESAFAPDENMTRAELVTALYRLAGSPAVKDAEIPFTDVDDGAACRDAVLWAHGKGIVSGRKNAKGEAVFEPDGDVKRQEIAKILNIYAASAAGKKELTNRVDELTSYADAGSVAEWAKPSMDWAAASGFITGGAGNKLDPDGTATRAQTAAILCRYMDDASTGDASKDNPRNQDGIGEKELLVVSFGTSFNDSRTATIGAVENALEKAFPGYAVRRGFTSNTIIEHIFRRDGEAIDDVTQALDRAKANGVKELLVQPTHLMNGYEYGDLVQELEERGGDFESVRIGAPLLSSDEDYTRVAEAMVAATAAYDDGKTAICYMGHGTEAASNGVYDRMQKILTDGGHTNYFVGTVEAEPSVETILKMVKAGGYEKVVLRPMMIVAGDHANNDMAGDEEDSWKSVFEANGYEVICVINGLGELEGIQQLLADHAKDAKELGSTGIEVEPNPKNVKPKTLRDGTYTISVSSDSKMFRVVACELTVKDGKMTAVVTLSGVGYDKLFAGTKAAAEKASEGFYEFVEDAEGKYTYTVPVEALDTQLPFAAHSVKKDEWYDRGLTFDLASAVEK